MSWTTNAVEANELQWDGRTSGHHEAYHLTVQDIDQGATWWFRYGVDAPERGEPRSALWGAYFPAKEPADRFALRTEFPARQFAKQSDGFHIRVSKGELSLTNAKGGLRSPSDERHKLRWNLSLSGRAQPLQLYPKRSMYRRAWPPTKVLCPIPQARASGVIEVGDQRFAVQGALARQTHVWGPHPFARWAWAHATGFREDASASVEALIGQPEVGERRLLVVHHRDGHGHTQRFHRLRMGAGDGSDQRPGVWTLSARRGRWTIEGRFSASLQSMAGLTLRRPDGGDAFLHSSGVGDATLEVYRHAFGKKRLDATLTARGTAVFEQGAPEPFDDVRFFV